MVKFVTLLLGFSQIVWCIPRFAVMNGTSCNLCHVNPAGGALRNDHGTTVFALDELPVVPWQKYAVEEWDGMLGDRVRIGGDFRLQALHYRTLQTGAAKLALFAMQADLYAFFQVNERVGLYLETGLDPAYSQPEYWLLFPVMERRAWIRVGRTLPNYGLRVDDHTSFIRGGNLRRQQGLPREGFPFSPLAQLPVLLETGLRSPTGWEFTLSLGNGFITGTEPGYGYAEPFEEKNITGRFYYAHAFDRFNGMIGTSFMREGDITLWGASGGVTVGRFTWTGEVDEARNWEIPGIEGSSIAVYHEVAYEPFQGLQLIGKYDFFDPDRSLRNGALTRLTLGLELFPLNILELKLQSRWTQVQSENTRRPKPEFLLQLHTWL
jgi:hypothetical protein